MNHLLDLASRKLWRLTGRPVDLHGTESWLAAPTSRTARVADGWLATEAARHGGRLEEDSATAGLLPSMAVLDGPGFDAACLRPEVRDFYEHTAAWQMEVWTGWSPVFWPAGELVSRLYGRRVEQLALPMRPLDVAHGMDSRLTLIRDGDGAQVAAAWVRTLRRGGRHVFSGCYSARLLPGADRPSVHVAFPLESGNVQVFLRPSVTAAGGLVLASPPGRFGQDGAYVVVRDRRDHAARVPLHETFHVYVDQAGVLRTDHELRLRRTWAVRLHYKLERAA
ncbi:hypothetical protein [Nocardioides coralli]|uniref:hypothetical protein n=1 Tax=Nocardioides coralli TaxID=2872154 RepID=UPI001CA3FF7D|nr:hypothetical protein [Nocardioides coralli]QZY28267.1 hypothetical protein K6T13_12350 [Nocardioides coralli]